MATASEQIRLTRAEAIRHSVRKMRESNKQSSDHVLDAILDLAGLNNVLRELLTNPNQRSNLKLVAFPAIGSDHMAIDAALEAGNTLDTLERLASASSFKFEGHIVPIHAPKNPDGQYERAKNGTIKVLCRASRMTDADKAYLRSCLS